MTARERFLARYAEMVERLCVLEEKLEASEKRVEELEAEAAANHS